MEPALIKPLQVLAPPVGEIANAQREGLKEHYGLGVAKKRGRPPKVVGGATPDQMGLSSVLRTYTRDEIFFALNDITHSADSLPTLARKWDKAINAQERIRIEGQIKEILQNPYRVIDPKTGDILLQDPGNKARETLRKALKLIFNSTTLPPVISKTLRTFKLPFAEARTLPPRVAPSQKQIQDAIQDNLPPLPSAKASPSSGKTTPASGATTPATPAGKGLKVGYSAEATGGLGHIYPISHNLILRMCEHLV